MTNQGEKSFAQEPDFSDEELWRELTQQLWLIARGSESSADNSADWSESLSEADSSTSVAAEDTRKADCLRFARYHEIARQGSTLTFAEREHLSGCRYCERHLAAFAELVPAAAQSTKAVSTKTTWFERITDLREALSVRRAIPALAVLAIIVVGAVAFFLIKYRPANENEFAAGPIKDANWNQQSKNALPSSTPSPDAPATPTVSPSANDSVLHRNNPPGNANATAQKSNRANSPIEQSGNASDESRPIVAAAEQEQIRKSLELGEISLEGSDFKEILGSTRSTENNNVSLIYPKNEATLDTRPTFRWRGPSNFAYRPIVTYLDGSEVEVDSFAVLSPGKGRLKKRLDPGIYYWCLAARRKGEPEENISGYIPFKIVSKAEIRQIKAAVKSTNSHLVRAILYARAGFLREAEIELKAELNKTPDSPIAKNMLTQVQDWRRK